MRAGTGRLGREMPSLHRCLIACPVHVHWTIMKLETRWLIHTTVGCASVQYTGTWHNALSAISVEDTGKVDPVGEIIAFHLR
jgi:hypothetical protein